MKYKFTGDTKQLECGTILQRIVCVTAFASVEVGELGGWIEKESCLSQTGDAWVYHEAQVYNNACVTDDAHVSNDARVYNNARICNRSSVSGNAHVYEGAHLFERSRVRDNARVFGKAHLFDDARICDDAQVFGEANIEHSAYICNNAIVCHYARVSGSAQIAGNAEVILDSHILLGLHRTKKVCTLQIRGSKHAVNSPDFNLIRIDDIEHTPQAWLANIEMFGRKKGYSKEQIAEYKKYIDLFAQVISEHHTTN